MRPAVSLFPFSSILREERFETSRRSLINSIARILRDRIASHAPRELYSNFSRFDQTTFCHFNIDFPRGVVFEDIKVDHARSRDGKSSCGKMFSEQNICSFNAQYRRGFVNVGISYIFHQSHDARTFVRFRRQRSGGSYIPLSESPAL